jgi:outer membrane murein-binding lipoprotein Lpp
MHFKPVLSALVISGLLLTGCTDSGRRDDQDIADDISETLEGAHEEMQSALDDAREEIAEAREQIRDAREGIQDDEIPDRRDDRVESALSSLGNAIKELGEAISDDSGPEPVDFRKLKDLLPSDVASMERYDSEGSRKGALGIKLSSAEGKYEGSDREMEIKILDLGSLSGVAGSGMDFIDAEIDREDNHGFERTTRYEGNPGYIKLTREGRRRRVQAMVMVENRFVVSVKIWGRSVSQDILDEVMDDIQLSRLKRWARR